MEEKKDQPTGSLDDINPTQAKQLYVALWTGVESAKAMQEKSDDDQEKESIKKALKSMIDLGEKVENLCGELGIDYEEIETGAQGVAFLKRLQNLFSRRG